MPVALPLVTSAVARSTVFACYLPGQSQSIEHPGRRFDVGLGWFRKPADAARRPAFVEHFGGGAGFFNLMRIYPERSLGVVVMGNATKYDVEQVVDELAALDWS